MDTLFGQSTSTFSTLGTAAPPQTERLAAHHGLVLLTLGIVLPLGQRLFHLAFGSAIEINTTVSHEVEPGCPRFDSPNHNDGHGAVRDAIPADAAHPGCPERGPELLQLGSRSFGAHDQSLPSRASIKSVAHEEDERTRTRAHSRVDIAR